MRRGSMHVGWAAAVALLVAGVPTAAAQQNEGSRVAIDEFRRQVEPLGRIVMPSINKLIGTWKFDPQASRFDNVFAPKDATRTYEDLGNGSYRYTQVTYSLDGRRSETQYIGRDDGTPSPVFYVEDGKGQEPTGRSISFRWLNGSAAEQMEEIIPGRTMITRRELSPDGKTMTLILPTSAFIYISPHADDPIPDIMIFYKQ